MITEWHDSSYETLKAHCMHTQSLLWDVFSSMKISAVVHIPQLECADLSSFMVLTYMYLS